jgi:predicted amidohydrolase YtcJ
MLDVFEAVDREIPFAGTRWFFDHCETIGDRNLDRVRALGGGIAIQNRMAFQGEYFLERYGKAAAERAPPVKRMLELGIPVGAGTDATRVSSYNPWLSLYWMVSGKSISGATLSEKNRLEREEALRLYTQGSSWFSGEEAKKGTLAPGQFADLAVLSADFLQVPEAAIKDIESLLTVVDGKIVYAAGEFGSLGPAPLPVLPEWSPIKVYGGYGAPLDVHKAARAQVPIPGQATRGCDHASHHEHRHDAPRFADFWGLGCGCFGF